MTIDFDHLLSKLPPVPIPFKDGAEGRIRTKPRTVGKQQAHWIKAVPLAATLVEAQGGHCGICGGPFFVTGEPTDRPGMRPTVDHVVPRSRGGANFGNVVAAHERCNGAKGGRMPTGCEAIWLDVANAGLGEVE